jgi:hypothetical protein
MARKETTYKLSTLLVALTSIWIRNVIVVADAVGADIRVVVVDGGRLLIVRTEGGVSDLKACGGVLLGDHGD